MGRVSGDRVVMAPEPYIPRFAVIPPEKPEPAPQESDSGSAADGQGDLGAALQAAYERGYREGQARAEEKWAEMLRREREALRQEHERCAEALREQLDAERARLQDEYAAVVRRLGALAEELRSQTEATRQDWIARISREAAGLVVDLLVTHVLAARQDPAALEQEIRSRLGGWLGGMEPVRIRVPEALSAHLAAALPGCEVIADSALQPGEVVLEGPFGVLDGREASLRASLREVVEGGLPGDAHTASDMGAVGGDR